MVWQAPDDKYAEHVKRVFSDAGFADLLGIYLTAVGCGWCESGLVIEKRHLQQSQFVHAGVQAAVAEHTARGAAGSLLRAEQGLLSIEFKINLLRPARGHKLRCRAEVLRPGSIVSVVEAEIFAVSSDEEIFCAKATVTLATGAAPERVSRKLLKESFLQGYVSAI